MEILVSGVEKKRNEESFAVAHKKHILCFGEPHHLPARTRAQQKNQLG